ncbi:acidic mammalian chitinase-like [Harmonia axyridis]|uniref:acidic mammalian chitinase-like n=1 Tax=Harmonia axyridis TaxID=115357 RepID=UPI001E275EF1|nr:acidic mammalian chitinase-like [Harmonia axyridis]
MILKVSSILIALILCLEGIQAGNNVLCYYGSWGASRPGNGSIYSRDIPAELCTHIFYAFLGLHENGTLKIANYSLDIEEGNLRGLSDLKKINPDLKTIFSIGGAADNTGDIGLIADDPVKLENMAQSAIDFCKEYNYNGIDVDWEYPNKNETFISLLKHLKERLEPHGLLLTAAVDQLPFNAPYDVVNMTKYLDLINVMSYDFHSPYYQTGQNSPLYSSPLEGEWQRDNLNANSSMVHWLEYGAIKEKLVMGCGFYGKAMILEDAANHGLMAPVKTANNPGPYTDNIGTLGYNELCDFHMKSATVTWDDDQKVPYLYEGDLWVGYDDERSVALKAQYVKDNNLFGLMMWSVETDDAHGNCGNGKWPLLNSINKVMKGSS